MFFTFLQNKNKTLLKKKVFFASCFM